MEGDFVVFIIGLYVHPRRVWRQLPQVLRAGAAPRGSQTPRRRRAAGGAAALLGHPGRDSPLPAPRHARATLPPPPHAGRAIRAMQAELAANPAAGCLAVRHTEAFANPTRLVQIWRRRAPRGGAARRGRGARARRAWAARPARVRRARAAGRACCARRARKRRRPPRSYDHLAAFARDGMAQHLGTWMAWDAKARAFKSRAGPRRGDLP